MRGPSRLEDRSSLARSEVCGTLGVVLSSPDKSNINRYARSPFYGDLVVASVARPVVMLNYKDMGALLYLDNSLWPLVVYYARGLNLDYADDADFAD